MRTALLPVMIFVVFISSAAYSQTSVLQDKAGQSTLALGGKGNYLFSVNAGDASSTLAFNHAMAHFGKNTFWGINLRLKATDGLAVLVEGLKVKPSFDLGAHFGRAWMTHRLFVDASLSNAYLNLVKPGISTAYTSRSFFGSGIKIGYNSIASTLLFSRKDAASSSILFGINAAFNKINNLDDLDPSSIYTTITTTVNNKTITLLKDKVSAFSGNYHTSLAFKLSVDAFVFPEFMSGRVGIGGYYRGQITGYQPRNSLGAGAVWGQKGAPTNITLGIMYQFNDVFNQLGYENNFLKRGGINLVAGYRF